VQHAAILSIGSELALGRVIDTNAPWLAARCAALGIRTVRQLTVADDRAPLRTALAHAVVDVDVLLITGGLGPTDDDLTRQALADAAGQPLVDDPASRAQIAAFFARRNRDMPPQNTVQALRPASATPIENTCGTAPGIRMALGSVAVFALPGVPFEMHAMFEREVAPVLAAAARGAVLRSRDLHTYGVPEPEVGARLADLMQRGRNPEVGTSADLGVITVRINAAADTPAAADDLLDAAEAEVRHRLGSAVYGRDGATLAAAVGAALVARGRTLATAESCTGGLIGQLLTETPGSSAYYVGGIVSYANEIKQNLLGVASDVLATHGAVSEPVAAAMARGARAACGADYAVAVTGIAGPGGGTTEKPVGLVCIGLATPNAVDAATYHFGSDPPRHAIRLRAARMALHRVRQALLAVRSES
jgi:nicotinamide-nucleotide amidase